MCLYSQLIKNPKYKPNKKNNGKPPIPDDPRALYVPVGCGNCIECTKQKARNWQVRLNHDIKENKDGKFMMMTFSDESILKLSENIPLTGYALDNQIATKAVKLFLGRWRKKFGKSIRHWLITELGHAGTENIHLHGILYTKESFQTINDIWQYGHSTNREYWADINYVGDASITYLTKYITKQDADHKNYTPKILCSPGIGGGYEKTLEAQRHLTLKEHSNEQYRLPNGSKIPLPIYYRNKVFDEETKEKLWMKKLDEGKRYICGEEIDAHDQQAYKRLTEYHRKRAIQLGYGTGTKDYDQIKYEEEQRILLHMTRLKRAAEKKKK